MQRHWGVTSTSDSRVLIVGAGLIGMKCAEGIRHLCKEMTIVDLAPRVLPAVLDETGSAIVQKQMEAQGISFRLADSVAKFTEDTAALKSGEVIPFDVLVLAVGVRPEHRSGRKRRMRSTPRHCDRSESADHRA